jgi:hypothetical protein
LPELELASSWVGWDRQPPKAVAENEQAATWLIPKA